MGGGKRAYGTYGEWGTGKGNIIWNMNKEFSTEEYQMTEKHLKKLSTSLIIREMQIKTTLKFHLTPDQKL